MSQHLETFRNVDVEWNKETGYLTIEDEKHNRLAQLYVEGED